MILANESNLNFQGGGGMKIVAFPSDGSRYGVVFEENSSESYRGNALKDKDLKVGSGSAPK